MQQAPIAAGQPASKLEIYRVAGGKAVKSVVELKDGSGTRQNISSELAHAFRRRRASLRVTHDSSDPSEPDSPLLPSLAAISEPSEEGGSESGRLSEASVESARGCLRRFQSTAWCSWATTLGSEIEKSVKN